MNVPRSHRACKYKWDHINSSVLIVVCVSSPSSWPQYLRLPVLLISPLLSKSPVISESPRCFICVEDSTHYVPCPSSLSCCPIGEGCFSKQGHPGGAWWLSLLTMQLRSLISLCMRWWSIWPSFQIHAVFCHLDHEAELFLLRGPFLKWI